MIRRLGRAGARRLRAGLGAGSQNRDVLGHGLLVVLAHGRADEGGLALEALLREKARQSFGEGAPRFPQKKRSDDGGTLLKYGLDVGHAGPPVVVLLVGVPH